MLHQSKNRFRMRTSQANHNRTALPNINRVQRSTSGISGETTKVREMLFTTSRSLFDKDSFQIWSIGSLLYWFCSLWFRCVSVSSIARIAIPNVDPAGHWTNLLKPIRLIGRPKTNELICQLYPLPIVALKRKTNLFVFNPKTFPCALFFFMFFFFFFRFVK